MSRYDYEAARRIVADDPPFYALVMAAMQRADTFNALKLRHAFPEVWNEVDQRYNAPGAVLPGDPPYHPVTT